MEAVLDNLDSYWMGLKTTVSLSVLAALLALFLGTVMAGFRVSPFPPLRAVGAFYVEVVRNTPLTVVCFFMALALPLVQIRLPIFLGAAVAYLLLTIPSGILFGIIERRVAILR